MAVDYRIAGCGSLKRSWTGPNRVFSVRGWFDWTVHSGDGTGSVLDLPDQGLVKLTQGTSPVVEIRKTVTVPDNPSAILFDYRTLFFAADAGQNAFEVAVLDESGQPVSAIGDG